jgi:hypothetical protein
MATYSQATINAMNARGRNLLDPNKAKPPKPTPAKTFTTNGATTLGVGGSRASDYSTAPKVSSVISSVGLGNQKVGSSSGSTSGGSVSTTSIDPGLTPPVGFDYGDIPLGGGATDPATDYYADKLAAQEEATRIRTQAARDANMANAGKVNTYSDQALQNAYILKEQNRVNLPQQLSALGYSGGATETSLTDEKARYENSRNGIERDRLSTLDDIYANDAQILATGNADLADVGAQYYQNLINKQAQDQTTAQSNYRWQTEFDADRADNTYSNKLALAQYKAELGDYSGLQELGINVNALSDQNGSTPTARKSTTTAITPTVNTQTNYYSDTDRRLSQLSIPSSQTALIRQMNMEGKLSDAQAEALLKKYGLVR